ncbi:MAG: FAD-binding oxidoreductase [Candidatus Bathyarchaeales archaeon]
MDNAIVKALADIVGAENVSAAKPITEAYVTQGIMEVKSNAPAIVVRPKSVEEVRAVLLLANEKKIPIVPHSGGLSGGEATPMKDGEILLDLRRMNQIIEVNPDARYMIVEPGVTSAQAWRYMQTNYPKYRAGVPDGAPPSATVMGDHLDRGFHFFSTRYGPAADAVLGLEVVLPTGEVVRTGSCALPTAKWFYKWMFGPDLTGIFLGAQGTLGVVTKMAVKIYPMPKFRDVVAFGASDWEYLVEPCLDVLKMEFVDLAQGGNHYLATCRRARYNWPPPQKPPLLPTVWMNFELGAETQEELNTIKNRIFQTLQKYQKEYGEKNIFEWKLDARNIGARLTKPNRISVPYAGHKGGGLLFITWYVPWKDSAKFGKEAEKLMEKHRFSPVVWLAAVDHGRQGLIMPIVLFDPKSSEEFDAVNTLDAEMTDKFLEMGGIPYRPNAAIHAPKTMKQTVGYFELLQRLKKTLDPNGIMHPGRLALLTEGC